jgi:hypothetical protein
MTFWAGRTDITGNLDFFRESSPVSFGEYSGRRGEGRMPLVKWMDFFPRETE